MVDVHGCALERATVDINHLCSARSELLHA